VLTNVEDEYIEALPLALQLHHRYPDNLGFRIPLSATQIAWGRPEAAMALLRVRADRWDRHEQVSARFFEARLLGMTGRATESAALLESFTPGDLASITWLPAWHPYYLGSAYDQLGRLQDAQVEYQNTVAAVKVADSHGYAKRAMDRRRSALDLAVAKSLTALCWRDSIEAAVSDLRQQLALPQQSEKVKATEAHYLLGCLELERGEYVAAVGALELAMEHETDQEAWLIARPRTRLLQALLWAGRFEEAQDYAQRFAESPDDWGSNQHLGLLVQTALHPEAHVVAFASTVPHRSDRLESFALRDIGFTSVVLLQADGRRSRRHAMTLRDGFWEIQLPMAPGAHAYRFELDGGATVPDPICLEVLVVRDQIWSLRRVPAIES
jgi:tetratricopeptide (TPR) repeat protein